MGLKRAGFVGKREAKRLQKAYAEQRAAWRAENPDRGHAIDDRCMYLAPPELRPRIGGEE